MYTTVFVDMRGFFFQIPLARPALFRKSLCTTSFAPRRLGSCRAFQNMSRNRKGKCSFPASTMYIFAVLSKIERHGNHILCLLLAWLIRTQMAPFFGPMNMSRHRKGKCSFPANTMCILAAPSKIDAMGTNISAFSWLNRSAFKLPLFLGQCVELHDMWGLALTQVSSCTSCCKYCSHILEWCHGKKSAGVAKAFSQKTKGKGNSQERVEAS